MHQSIFIGQHNTANDRNRCTIHPSYRIGIDVTAFVESQMSAVGNLNVQCIWMFACKSRKKVILIVKIKWSALIASFSTYLHELWSVRVNFLEWVDHLSNSWTPLASLCTGGSSVMMTIDINHWPMGNCGFFGYKPHPNLVMSTHTERPIHWYCTSSWRLRITGHACAFEWFVSHFRSSRTNTGAGNSPISLTIGCPCVYERLTFQLVHDDDDDNDNGK